MRHAGLLLVSIFATALPVHADECTSLAAVEWILGEWASPSDEKTVVESWRRVSPDTFEGWGGVQSPESGTVVVTETLRLVAMSGGVYYIAKVAENDLPVPFAMTSCGRGFATFTNPAHDFPKELGYRLEDENRLTVTVGGDAENGFAIEFVRVVGDS